MVSYLLSLFIFSWWNIITIATPMKKITPSLKVTSNRLGFFVLVSSVFIEIDAFMPSYSI